MLSVSRLRLKKDAGMIFNQVQWQNSFARKPQWIQQSVPVYGGNGYVSEHHVERMMRDAKQHRSTKVHRRSKEL
jgi:hypothetical protein